MPIIRSHFNAFLCWFALGLIFAAPLSMPSNSLAHDGARIWLVVEPSPGMPKCDEFFDKWDAPGAPSGMMAMMGFAREVFAAKDCLAKNNIPVACKHWQGLLTVMDKLGPPLSENRGDVEEMTRQHSCAALPASDLKSTSDQKPETKVAPSSKSTPAKPVPEAGPSPATDPAPAPGPASGK